MAGGTVLSQVRTGMEVRSSDGGSLGKVKAIWYGTDPATSTERCDEEICSRLEVHHGLFGREVLYIPYSAIAGVTDGSVMLNVDADTVHASTWNQKPHWIPVGKNMAEWAVERERPWV